MNKILLTILIILALGAIGLLLTLWRGLYLGYTYLRIRGQLRDATVLLAQALPIMLVLFVFFPRVIGPFWGLPGDAHAGITGLGDSMTPGNISKLAKSDALAFRVQFADAQDTPPPAERYWRGPVLHSFDGASWRDTGERPWRPLEMPRRGPEIRYRVTLEPSGRPWLLALDLTWVDYSAYVIPYARVTHAKYFTVDGASRPASRISAISSSAMSPTWKCRTLRRLTISSTSPPYQMLLLFHAS